MLIDTILQDYFSHLSSADILNSDRNDIQNSFGHLISAYIVGDFITTCNDMSLKDTLKETTMIVLNTHITTK